METKIQLIGYFLGLVGIIFILFMMALIKIIIKSLFPKYFCFHCGSYLKDKSRRNEYGASWCSSDCYYRR